ncbi:MAG: PEP-CTERM sorting domain-containing protein [Planctomycetota bacterium]
METLARLAGVLAVGTSAAVASAEVTLRFVDPTTTDPAINDVVLPNADGFARDHVIAIDPSLAASDRLFLWLPGTGASPTQYQLLAEASAATGMPTIGLVYDSHPPVNLLTLNDTDPELPETIRRTRLFGEDGGPDSPVQVDEANGVVNRLVRVLQDQHTAHPDEGWDRFLSSSGGVEWGRVVVGGHSHGAGHAAYLSKQFPLAGGLMFGGPGDFVRDFGQAPWLFDPAATSADRLFGFTHIDDPNITGFLGNQRTLGLEDFGPIQNVDGKTEDELTSHMLISLADLGPDANYHSANVIDQFMPFESDGTPTYLPAWSYLFDSVDDTTLIALGDANLDGRVDLADFGVLRANFGVDDRFWQDGDFNADRQVDLADFGILRANFGGSLASFDAVATPWLASLGVVPEPSASLALIAGFGLVGLRRGRRL